MPNQSDPNSPQTTATPPVDNTPSVVMPDFQSTDIPPAPPDIPPIISSSPKKKFGTGKIIATILGFLILAGGIVGGVVLTQQQQDIREKAQGGSIPGIDPNCVNIGSPAARQKCDRERDEQRDPDGNGIPDEHPNPLPDCTSGGEGGVGCTSAEANPTGTVGSGFGEYCGSESTGIAACPGEPDSPIHGYYTLNYGEGNCQAPTFNECLYYPIDTSGGGNNGGGGGGGNGGGTPTPPGSTAQCLNVKAYNSSWTQLTGAQLSSLTSGTTVNFCVAGSVTGGGSFDKAQFKINSEVKPETTTKKPSSNDFCQSYTIPAGTTTFNIKAKIHHTTLNWFGEDI